jgi:aminoglycoside phosphotransferase (APT) family kinase protein
MSEIDNDFDGTMNWSNLQEWVTGQSGLPGSGPLTEITELQGGSQNKIFLLERGDAKMVLRRPPKHLRPGNNEIMLREAKVLTGLEGTDVPHADLYGVCADDSVIGATFYVMQLIDGFGPRGPLPGKYGTDPVWRRSMAEELVSGAAKLGLVDPYAVGLGNLGKPEGWAERQVSRWKSQLDGYSEMEGYDGPDLPGFEQVAAWLTINTPRDYKIGINHGDCQWANVMFAHDEPKLVAFVDWEMSTLGDPLLDLGWMLTSWVEPRDPAGHSSQIEPWDGFPTRADVVAQYIEMTGRDLELVPWFFTLACYKLGVVLEGTYARACAGKVPLELGKALHDYAGWLFAKARQLVNDGPDW